MFLVLIALVPLKTPNFILSEGLKKAEILKNEVRIRM
jgi:hypothetical protein